MTGDSAGSAPGFDFFRVGELPVPTLGEVEVAALLARQFGVRGTVTSLGSQQDQNFLVRDEGGAVRGVLKITNPAFTAAEIAAQDEASDRVAAFAPDLRVATVLRGASGAPLAQTVETSEGPLHLRLLTHLAGGTLTGDAYLAPAQVARMGDLAATASLALRGFEHPGLDRVLQWDLRNAARVVDLLAEHVADAGRRRQVIGAAREAWDAVTALAEELPVQPGHLDLTDDNLVRSPDSGLADGLIDFGDASRSWAIAELAVTISSVLHHAGAEPCSVLPAVRAFHRRRPLSRAEADALWPLVVLRGAVLVVSGEHQLAIDDGNVYAAEGVAREWRIFERASSVPMSVMAALIADALGFTPSATPEWGGGMLLPGARDGMAPDGIALLDLGVEAAVADDGAWLAPGLAEHGARELLAQGAPAVATRFGAPRIDATRALSSESPATIATGVDVWFGAAAEVVSPVDGVVSSEGDALVVGHAAGKLVLTGLVAAVSEGDRVAVGDMLGTTERLHVQARRPGAPPVASLVRPEYAAGWLAHVDDPSPLLGLAPAPAAAGDALLERRGRFLAEVQEHYYADPPRIERGWRHHLLDAHGRAYLDVVNNVTSIGHAHPRLTAAVTRQLKQLNTNSRFHYGAIVEFAERLAETLPDPLDTVFLVNSGSEAVDLALRIAMAATGRTDVVAVREAYHGWTYASDAVSTSVADNPDALATRPDWVHTVDAPNSYRGRHRGSDASRYGPEAASVISALADAGHPPAAFIAETLFGNAGGIPLPEGYLAAVYSAVRAAGGLAIADEVQVGYGRLGATFWGFQQQGVVPDVVAVAKSIGNGYPLGAVITSKAVADAYRTQGYFFSSTGGSPVSSVVGLTVLDVIRDEGLQANARATGGYLTGRLEDLGRRHPIIGAVHGLGLYLGVELVRDRETLEPAAIETAALCERLRELGVIVQPTGDHQNVLKVKPPLCIDREAADFFVATLDRALTDLGC